MKLDFINIRIIERFNFGLKEIRCSDLQSGNNFYDFVSLWVISWSQMLNSRVMG